MYQPAMAAGVTTKLWQIGDIVALLELEEKHNGKEGGS
jgi:hypothetical protein